MADRLKAKLAEAGRGVNRDKAEEIADALYQLATSGESHAVRAIELIMDRTDGKVTIPVSVSNVTLVLSQDDYDAVP